MDYCATGEIVLECRSEHLDAFEAAVGTKGTLFQFLETVGFENSDIDEPKEENGETTFNFSLVDDWDREAGARALTLLANCGFSVYATPSGYDDATWGYENTEAKTLDFFDFVKVDSRQLAALEAHFELVKVDGHQLAILEAKAARLDELEYYALKDRDKA